MALLYLLIYSCRFFVDSFWFSLQCCLCIEIVLVFFFPICMPLISFSCLIALSRALWYGWIEVVRSPFLYGVLVGGGVQRSSHRVVWVVPPSPQPVVLSAGGMRSCLFLPQTLQKWQLGFVLSLYLLVQNFPQLHMRAVFLVPCRFFVSCCWRRGVSRCKQCAKGRRSQLLACLKK